MLIDSAPTVDEASLTDQRCDGAISLRMGVTEDRYVTRLDAYIDPTTATNVRFAVWTHPAHSLVYYSAPVAVAAGLQWVQSPSLFLFLRGGTDFDMAAMVEGCANFPWDLAAGSANGVVTYANNGNPTNYAAPTAPVDCCSVDPRFQIWGGADTDGDIVLDDVDNCPTVANPSQADIDGDGIGNACDATDDRDSGGCSAVPGAAGSMTGIVAAFALLGLRRRRK